MTILYVYHLSGKFYGETVEWKRSGSGTYREITRIEIPQSKAEIEIFAAENRYKVEWRNRIPDPAASVPASAPASV